MKDIQRCRRKSDERRARNGTAIRSRGQDVVIMKTLVEIIAESFGERVMTVLFDQRGQDMVVKECWSRPWRL